MIALHGGTVYTVTQGVIEDGTVLIEGSRITAVGKRISIPDGCRVIDVAGKVIMPGMIDCHTHLGIAVEGVGDYGNDKNEVDLAIGPHLRALDAINPEDRGLYDARAGGITAIIVTPGSENVIGGLSVAIKTYGTVIDDMVLRHPAGLKVSFGENPKRKCMQKQTGFPSTRMGIAALIREQFVKAQDYLRRWERSQYDPSQLFQRDLALEAIAGVLKGEYPLRAHAHQAEDIMTAMRIAEEFSIGLTIEHTTEGYKIAEKLAKRNIPCTIGPSLTARVKVELNNRNYKTPGLLYQAGVKVALISDHPILPVDCLRMEAIMAIREGLPKEAALRAVTIDAAEIMGVNDRIGSLEAGKDADILVLDGHLFDLYTCIERVFISGQEVITN